MIRLANATKNFDSKSIITDLSYEFPTTGLYQITGSSGSGKTTLLRIIAGLEKLDTGTLFSTDSVSFAFQEYRLFPWLDALSNVTVAAFETPGEAELSAAKSLLIRLGFEEAELKLLPREMSGGMKQRVSLARAFIRPSDVLILDEPTKELDADLVNTVYEIIKEISEDRLVIFTSHQALPSDFQVTATLCVEDLR